MIDRQIIELLGSFLPEQVEAYLESTGWQNDGALNNVVAVWHRPEGDDYDWEIIQPLVNDLKDFIPRSYDLVNTLSKFENRSPQMVSNDILGFSADKIRIRVVHEDVENGSIPLSDGVLLVDNAKDLLTSVTKSTFIKKRYFAGGGSKAVNDLISTFRLGQTEVGSYVVNLIIPVSHSLDKQSDLNEISLTRSVSKTLARSLRAIDKSLEAYRDTGDDQSFDQAVEEGVSANLCDALVGLTGVNQTRDIHINISLSTLDKEGTDLPLQYTFQSSLVEHLKRASDYYKEKYIIYGYKVSGPVTGLKHETNEEVGIVTVSSLVNGKDKSVTLELPLEDYWKAHNAHAAKGIIECTGNLYVNPRSTHLTEITGFSVISNKDLFES